MDAKILYHIVFVGNEPYKNDIKRLNDLKRQFHQSGAELQENDCWNMLMLDDLVQSRNYYVRNFISGVFKILIFKISKSKTPEIEIFRNRSSEHL